MRSQDLNAFLNMDGPPSTSGEAIPRMKGRMASFCMERSGHLASHWDQGISFFAADRMWLQPPGWVHKMVSRHDTPAVWVAFSPSGLHSSQDASDICADRAREDARKAKES